MLTTTTPATWQDLQRSVCAIMAEAGLTAAVEHTVRLTRGKTVVDVYATENVSGRERVVLVEYKHWKARVPQEVVRGFRTTLADAGADVGYVVSKAGFQAGALEAAKFTNVRLLTWTEFQEEFEPAWIAYHLLPTVEDKFRRLSCRSRCRIRGRGHRRQTRGWSGGESSTISTSHSLTS